MKKYIIQELNTQSYLINANKDTKEQAENIADAAIERKQFINSTFTVIKVFIPKGRFTSRN